MGIHQVSADGLPPDAVGGGLFDCIDALGGAFVADGEESESLSWCPQQVAGILGALAEAADEAGLPGLIDVSVLLADRISMIDGEPSNQTRLGELLVRFPLLVMDYVLAPGDPDAVAAILDFLQEEGWPVGAAAEEIELLRLLLLSSPALDDDSAEAALPLVCAAPEPEPDLNPAETATGGGVQLDFSCDANLVQSIPTEMLALAVEAFEASYAGLDEALALAAAEDREQRDQGWEQLCDELERLAAGAEAMGFGALARLLLGARTLLDARRPNLDVLAVMADLPDRLRDYLSDPLEPSRADALVAILRELDVAGVACEGLSQLARSLSSVEFIRQDAVEQERRPVVAERDAVSLDVPDDINQELLDGLLIELPIQTSAFTEAIQHIASGQGRVVDLDIAKRSAHTLKGAANTVGVKGIASLTHYLEDILIVLAEHRALPNLGLSQTLAYAADCLEAMSEALTGSGQAPEDAIDVLQDVLNWANRIDAQGIEVAAAAHDAASADESPESEAAPARPERDAVPMLRVSTSLVDEQLRLVGEAMTSTAQIQNRLQLALRQIKAVDEQNRMLRQLAHDLEDLVDLRGIALPRPAMTDTGFDTLEFDQYDELHTVARRLVEITTDAHEITRGTQEQMVQLADLVTLQARTQLESQNAVLRTRMVPVTSVAARLHRAVRQTGRLLDKEVELVLKGAETLIDGNLLTHLVDALMHVLRNAVDHGIEPAERRLAAGKDPVGHIELTFRREGDVTIVTCRDDGRGLDLEQIRQQAHRRGLVGDAGALSDDQIARFILAAGFSTREGTTQVSGRGIGLDAVNAMVEELKGSITLRTHQGAGLSVEIRLPTTLLSVQALLTRSGGTMLAIAARGIEEIHFVTADQLRLLGDQCIYRHGGQILDVLPLADLLHLDHRQHAREPDGARRAETSVGQPLMIVRMSSGVLKAVLVEEITESRSLVVKKLGPYVGRIDGVVGATILGDGGVASVVDLPDLLRAAEGAGSASGEIRLPRAVAGSGLERPSASAGMVRTALIVDDSISARRMTAQVFRDAGFDVRTAIDGLEAVTLLNRLVPDLIMTDLEMPRMNGLELAAHVRARDATKNVPIVMITSRSTEKHRQQAQANGVDLYLTKPFRADDLLRQIGALAGGRG